ncbi:MAG: hypothetical protein VZR56_04845 [Treponema sp.]|nr:hypothetical protein [Treponema sp.]
MKEISKIVMLFIVMGCLSIALFSCRMGSMVNFESESYERFKSGGENFPENLKEGYFARVMIVNSVELVLQKLSKEDEFDETLIADISIKDDKNSLIYKKDSISFRSVNVKNTSNEYYQNLYICEIDENDIEPDMLEKYKTKYIIFHYEIDGIQYSEKLKRTVVRYPILRT